jgi:MacB-like periplasmic core domain
VEQTTLFYRRAQEELSKLPGVEAVAANHSLPLAGNDNYGKPAILIEGRPAEEQVRNPFVNAQIVSPNYFGVAGIPLLRGRAFTDHDRATTQRVAVISLPLAERLFGSEDPLLKRVRLTGLMSTVTNQEGAWFTIVGVVGGVRSERLLGGPGLDLYFSNQQQYSGDSYFILRTKVPPETLGPQVARAVQRLDPEQSISGIRTGSQRPLDSTSTACSICRRCASMRSVTPSRPSRSDARRSRSPARAIARKLESLPSSSTAASLITLLLESVTAAVAILRAAS